MSVFIALLLFCGLACILVGLRFPNATRNAAVARLSELMGQPRTLEDLELEQPFTERVLRPLVRRFAALGERFSPRNQQGAGRESAIEKTYRRLLLAGNPNRWTVSDWLGIKLFSAVIVAGLAVLPMMLLNVVFVPLAALGGGLLGFIAPDFWLARRIRQRQAEIRRVLPGALDLMVIAVEGGLGFDGAIQRVSARSNNALSQELSRALAEMRVGRSRREALQEMVARTQVQELANFVSAIIQAEQLGVSVAQVLGVQAEQMRVMRRQWAEEQAQQAPLKMLIPMLIFIFPALCIVVLGPLVPAIAGIWK